MWVVQQPIGTTRVTSSKPSTRIKLAVPTIENGCSYDFKITVTSIVVAVAGMFLESWLHNTRSLTREAHKNPGNFVARCYSKNGGSDAVIILGVNKSSKTPVDSIIITEEGSKAKHPRINETFANKQLTILQKHTFFQKENWRREDLPSAKSRFPIN